MEFLVSAIKSAGTLSKNKNFNPVSLMGQRTFDQVVFDKEIAVKTKVQWTEGDIYVSGEAKTIGTFVCDRCLAKFGRDIKGEFSQTFNPELEKINLTGEIRGSVLLNLPMKKLCNENCLGLCQKCGANRNINKCKCPQKAKTAMGNLLDKSLKNQKNPSLTKES